MGSFCKITVVFLKIVIFYILKVLKITKVTASLKNLMNFRAEKMQHSS